MKRHLNILLSFLIPWVVFSLAQAQENSFDPLPPIPVERLKYTPYPSPIKFTVPDAMSLLQQDVARIQELIHLEQISSELSDYEHALGENVSEARNYIYVTEHFNPQLHWSVISEQMQTSLPDIEQLPPPIDLPSVSSAPVTASLRDLQGEQFLERTATLPNTDAYIRDLKDNASRAQAARGSVLSGKQDVWNSSVDALRFSTTLYENAHESQARRMLHISETLTKISIGALDIATAFTPGINDARDWYELTTGRDLIYGTDIGISGRLLSGLGLLLGSGAAYRTVLKHVRQFFSPENYTRLLNHFVKSKAGQGLTQEGIQGLQKISRQDARSLIEPLVLNDPKLANRMGELIQGSQSAGVVSGKHVNDLDGFDSFPPSARVVLLEGMPDTKFFRSYDNINAKKEGFFLSPENPRSMTKSEYRSKYSITEEMNKLTRIASTNVGGRKGFLGPVAEIPGRTQGGGIQLKLEHRIPDENWIDEGAWVE